MLLLILDSELNGQGKITAAKTIQTKTNYEF